MGGYGAMRIATVYSENFGSVSAVSAPLDFNGLNNNSGFITQFQEVINNMTAEGIAYADMDTSSSDPLRNLFFAAATSFSPHDTNYTGRFYIIYDPLDADSDKWHATDTSRITDMNTYFAPDGPDKALKFHLPFDENGDTYNPIWSLWLENNMPTIAANHPQALDSVAIMLWTSADGANPVYDFDQQTLDFAMYLQGQGISHSRASFSGYEGYEATGNRFLYDLMGDILKYHSDNFDVPE
jgi:hypothetical protein